MFPAWDPSEGISLTNAEYLETTQAFIFQRISFEKEYPLRGISSRKHIANILSKIWSDMTGSLRRQLCDTLQALSSDASVAEVIRPVSKQLNLEIGTAPGRLEHLNGILRSI